MGRAALVNAAPEMTKKEMDLRQDIIDPVLEELHDDIHNFHIRIDNRLGSIQGNRITVRAGKMWLKAVYRNLFRNAVKHGGEGCMIAFGFEDHESYSQFNVYNTGRSIPQEHTGKLFTPFGRIEDDQRVKTDAVRVWGCISSNESSTSTAAISGMNPNPGDRTLFSPFPNAITAGSVPI